MKSRPASGPRRDHNCQTGEHMRWRRWPNRGALRRLRGIHGAWDQRVAKNPDLHVVSVNHVPRDLAPEEPGPDPIESDIETTPLGRHSRVIALQSSLRRLVDGPG